MIKKIIQKIHQILGSLLSLVFVVWFVSGFVMIFEGFPHASQEYQLQQQVPLASQSNIINISKGQDIKEIKLERVLDTPVYEITYTKGNPLLLNATNLDTIDDFTRNTLDKIIEARYQCDYIEKVSITDFDQWIPWSHLNKHFPIYKYYLNDDHHSVIYISAKTANIIQETTRKQRWAARFGAIPHWFYFKSLRLQKGLWKKVVIWVSFFGCVTCVSGIIMGFIRLRRKNNGTVSSPFKKTWYKWHHIIGLIFGLFTFTFVLSGLMSLSTVPKWIIPVHEEKDYRKILFSDHIDINSYQLSVQEILRDTRLAGAKKIVWKQFAGEPYYLIYSQHIHEPKLVLANQKDSVLIKTLEKKNVRSFLQDALHNHNIYAEWLTGSDEYIKLQKQDSPSCLKVALNDRDNTILYINLDNLELLKMSNKNTRIRRWLYKGLHSFDFSFFAKYNWIRNTWLILLSIGGTILSTTSLFLGIRYYNRKLTRTKDRLEKPN